MLTRLDLSCPLLVAQHQRAAESVCEPAVCFRRSHQVISPVGSFAVLQGLASVSKRSLEAGGDYDAGVGVSVCSGIRLGVRLGLRSGCRGGRVFLSSVHCAQSPIRVTSFSTGVSPEEGVKCLVKCVLEGNLLSEGDQDLSQQRVGGVTG